MRSVLEREGLSGEFELDSAGTIGYHTGNPPDARMTKAAKKRGVIFTGSARQIQMSDLAEFDLILVMDRENHRDVMAMQRSAPDVSAKIQYFCEYCTQSDLEEVPDPYYGGSSGFELVLDLMEDGCEEIARLHREGKLLAE